MTEYQTHAALVQSLEAEVSRLKAVNAELKGIIEAGIKPNNSPAQAARQALEVIEHHGGHLPWNAFVEVRKDLREALEAAPQPAEGTESELPSDSSTKLAETILSDCGCSSNYTPLLERVAKRIDRHIEALEAAPADSNHEAFKLGYAKGVDDAERRAKARGEQPVAVEQEPAGKYLTVVYHDLTRDEAQALIHHEKMSAASWSHALHERDAARAVPQPTRQPLADKRVKVKLGSQYGSDLAGHWFYLHPADEYAEAVLDKRAHGIGGGE